MLVKTVSFYDFLNEFEKHGRENQFSYEGKKALFDYLNELSEDLGEAIELDVVALCCEFSEYKNLKEFNRDYSYSIGHDVDCVDEIYDYTTVIPVGDETFIIQDF